MSSSRESSQLRDRTHVSCVSGIGRGFFTTSNTWEAYHAGAVDQRSCRWPEGRVIQTPRRQRMGLPQAEGYGERSP